MRSIRGLLLALTFFSSAHALTDSKIPVEKINVLRCTFKSSSGQNLQIVTQIDTQNKRRGNIIFIIGDSEADVHHFSDAYVKTFEYDPDHLEIDAAVVPGVNAGIKNNDGALKAHLGSKSDLGNLVRWKYKRRSVKARPDISVCTVAEP